MTAPLRERERPLPQDIDAEGALLGSLMLGADFAPVLQIVGAEDGRWLIGSGHQDIFRALLGLHTDGRPIDLVTTRDALNRAGALDRIGGVNRLVEIASAVPSAGNARHYADIVRQMGLRRDLIVAAGKIATDASDTTEDTGRVLELACNRLAGLSERNGLPYSPQSPWATPREVMGLPAFPGGMRCATTTYDALDDALGGGLRAGVNILASRTGNAKSMLTANIARRAALDGTRVLLLTLEDPILLSMWRMVSATANVPLSLLIEGIHGRHGPAVDGVRDAYSVLADLPLRLADCRALADVVATIRLHAAEGGELVLLDQISKVDAGGETAATAYERTNAISEALRLVALETGLPILVVVQVNREASKRDGQLEINDLRDSGMLEQDAVSIALIDKAMDAPRCSVHAPPTAKILPIRIGKNRFGPTGRTARLLWSPVVQRIETMPQAMARATGGDA